MHTTCRAAGFFYPTEPSESSVGMRSFPLFYTVSMKESDRMIFHRRQFFSGILALFVLFCTFSAAGCGKDRTIVNNKVESVDNATSSFAENFFTQSNLPYQKLSLNDVQNSSDEFLFYIPNGEVYRTTGNYTVVIVARKELRETPEQKKMDYSGALYQIFEEDSIDLLKYCAAGQYALMTLPSTIPDWDENELIEAFMTYASDKPIVSE